MDAQALAIQRNRENQRRSRARRNAYTQDLEKRLRQFERDGIQVTAQVQAAARKVAEENLRLRELLGGFGMNDAEINQYLSNGSGISYVVPQLSSQKSHTVANLAAQTTEQRTSNVSKDGQFLPRTRIISTVHAMLPLTHDSLSPSKSVNAGQTVTRARPDLLERPAPAVDQAKSSLHTEEAQNSWPATDEDSHADTNPSCSTSDEGISAPETRDETSCEIAARIIAGMRGSDDAEGVWPELGCSNKQKCMVKNIALFQIMDK